MTTMQKEQDIIVWLQRAKARRGLHPKMKRRLETRFQAECQKLGRELRQYMPELFTAQTRRVGKE